MSSCCRSTARGYNRLGLDWRSFLFPFKQGLPQATLDSLSNTCENSSKGRRCGPRNPTTFPLEEHAPLQEASVAELQRAAPYRPLLACPAGLPAQLPCRNSPPGKAQGKRRHDHVLHEPFSSFRNQYEAASYFDLLLYSARSSLCHPFPPG